jgi:hypothetical protein
LARSKLVTGISNQLMALYAVMFNCVSSWKVKLKFHLAAVLKLLFFILYLFIVAIFLYTKYKIRSVTICLNFILKYKLPLFLPKGNSKLLWLAVAKFITTHKNIIVTDNHNLSKKVIWPKFNGVSFLFVENS